MFAYTDHRPIRKGAEQVAALLLRKPWKSEAVSARFLSRAPPGPVLSLPCPQGPALADVTRVGAAMVVPAAEWQSIACPSPVPPVPPARQPRAGLGSAGLPWHVPAYTQPFNPAAGALL